MITLETYLMGRDKEHPDDYTPEIRDNAEELLENVNDLLDRAGFDSIRTVNSGWRPKGVNDATANAAAGSKHLSGQAVDLPDPNRDLARFLVHHRSLLEEFDLWMEDPRWTPTWVHLQSVPPKSGKTIFIPSSKPPLASELE